MAGGGVVGTIHSMCRYSDPTYRTHYVCVPCRSVRKEWLRGADNPVLCVSCRQPMLNAGKDFHAPRRRNRRQWEKLAVVFANGQRFHSCGCGGPGACPKTIVGVRAEMVARARRREAAGPIKVAEMMPRSRRTAA